MKRVALSIFCFSFRHPLLLLTFVFNDLAEFTVDKRLVSPSDILIKMESFSLFSKHGIRKYESTEFAAGDYKWKLIIYPDGNQDGKKDHISAYLAITQTSSLPQGWEVNAVFTVFIYNQILDNYLCFGGRVCRFHALKYKWGFSKMISRKYFKDPSNGYLVDDNCFFGAEVYVIKTQRVFECLSLQKGKLRDKCEFEILRFSKLTDVWNSEEFCTAGGYKWKIKLYPNGDDDEEGKSVSIYLKAIDLATHKKVNANYCIRILNQVDGSSKSCSTSHWFTSSRNWGWPAFAPLADMRDPKKGLVVGDRCVLEIEISLLAVVKA